MLGRIPFQSGDILESIDDCKIESDRLARDGKLHRLLVAMLYPRDPRVRASKVTLLRNFRRLVVSGSDFQKITALPAPRIEFMTRLPVAIEGSWTAIDNLPYRLRITRNARGYFFAVTNPETGTVQRDGPFRFLCGRTTLLVCHGYDTERKRVIRLTPETDPLWINAVKDTPLDCCYGPYLRDEG
jgi:hypothetical protein